MSRKFVIDKINALLKECNMDMLQAVYKALADILRKD